MGGMTITKVPWTAVAARPLPGDIGLTQISGEVGKLIRIGQWLNGDGFADYQHAFVYVGGDQIIEAEPGGARLAPVSEYSNIYWCRNLSKNFNPADRAAIVAAALKFKGVPYSAADYLALAAKRLHIPAPHLDKFVKSTGHVICSQLCAASYDQAHLPIYDHWTGWVTPLDLYNSDKAAK